MKTAISIPDDLFNSAEETARQLHIPRSQLYAMALEAFLKQKNSQWVTDKLNQVYSGDNAGTEPEELGLESLRSAVEDETW